MTVKKFWEDFPVIKLISRDGNVHTSKYGMS